MKAYHLLLLTAFFIIVVGLTAKADWGIPVNLGPPVNTPDNLELEPTVDPGDTILVFRSFPPVGDPHLRMSKKVNGLWSTPESLGSPFIPPTELSTCIVGITGGIRLYFSSMRVGGQGGSDIWYTDLINDQWSNPINMGYPLNSAYNDNGFRIKGDGLRAYFTSQRPGSHGDHDIWVSDYLGGQWADPVNLGDSVNSGYSDQDPAMTEDEQELYFWRGGPGMQEPQIFTSKKINGGWQGATRVGKPIHWRPYWGEDGPYFLPPGNRLYYSGGEDTTRLGGGDIWYVDRVVGVGEKEEARGQRLEVRLTAIPNPFTSFAALPGHEAERFNLYDVSGRKVGVFKGDRIGEGLAPGVYFLKSVGQDAKPVRIVKLR